MTNICLHIIDLQSDDIDNIFQITICSKTLENQNIVCHVTDFKPSFYVKIPEKWSKIHFKVELLIILNLKHGKKYINVEIKPPQYHYDFYEYQHDFINDCRKKDKYIKLVFDNYRSFNKYKYEIKNLFHNSKNLDDWKNICNDECQANLYETDIHQS